jgi:rhodanese-related sulfurtransferase
MKTRITIITLFLSLFGTVAAWGQSTGDASLNAPICAKCHQAESNMMLGFLKDVSFKAGTILMDLLNHKEVIYFDDETRVKNLTSLEDMAKYKGKGFRIYFAEENGRKQAVLITRFDILQLVNDKDKLNLQDVEALMAAAKPPVLVDVRPGPHYQAGHIAGAVNVPAPAFDKFKKNLPKDTSKTLVVYGVGGCLSPSVAVNTMALGYDDVRIYTSGFPQWSKNHYAFATASFVKKGLNDHSLVILDLRAQSEAQAGHLPGAANADFAHFSEIRAKLPANKKAPIILYGPHREEAAKILLGWGYKKIRLLEGNLAAWQKNGLPMTSGQMSAEIVYIPKVNPGVIKTADFKKLAAHADSNILIDVRNTDEFEEGHIPGSINIPEEDLADRLVEIPADKPITVFCNSGVRAEMAYSILKKQKYNVHFWDALLTIDKSGSFNIKEK